VVVVGFWNDYKTVLLKLDGKIVGYDRFSLETCIGRGDRIELEIGDSIQNSFDKEFTPKTFFVPDWLEKKFLTKRSYSSSNKNYKRY
jgi:hypothetical protein